MCAETPFEGYIGIAVVLQAVMLESEAPSSSPTSAEEALPPFKPVTHHQVLGVTRGASMEEVASR